jgi:hypothetical protein
MIRDPLTLVRRELRDQLRQRVDARGLATAPPTERRMRVREEAMAVLRERGAILPARELARVVNEISDDVVGFGPIEYLLKDPSVTEVMVNGPDDVFVEREGPLVHQNVDMLGSRRASLRVRPDLQDGRGHDIAATSAGRYLEVVQGPRHHPG